MTEKFKQRSHGVTKVHGGGHAAGLWPAGVTLNNVCLRASSEAPLLRCVNFFVNSVQLLSL